MATYPSCITDSQLCSFCYTSESCDNCLSDNTPPSCSDYCDSGCNTICVTAQTFCNLGVENINRHADVPKIVQPSACFAQNEFIHKAWTADYWNKVREKLVKAAAQGRTQRHGSLPGSTAAVKDTNLGNANSHPSNSLVTAQMYNQVIAMMNKFNQSLTTVKKDDVIKAAHAQALVTGAKNARFNKGVCDICNTGGENRNDCNCDCSCDCDCNCDCSCDCDCSNPNP